MEAGAWNEGRAEHSCLKLARPISSRTHHNRQYNSGGNFCSNLKGKKKIFPLKLSRKSSFIWDWMLGFQFEFTVKIIQVSVI